MLWTGFHYFRPMTGNWKPRLSNYWLCQLTGWLGMVFVEMTNYTFFIVGKFNTTILYTFLSAALLGLLLTHTYRYFINKWPVFQKPMSYIWILALLSTLLLALIITIITQIGWVLITDDDWKKNFTFITIAASIMNWARYVGVWIIIYFMYKIMKQNNKIREEKTSFESLAKTTELELLKSQLNPHFLFNALNVIKALVAINPEQSRDAIVKLSELLRFTLQYGKERLIPLKFELQEVAKYLELEQLRFGERLSVSFDIPQHLQHVAIPPAIALTLAENAVKHGVARHMGDGFIRIGVTEATPGTCALAITNSGNYQPTSSSGIGLKHVTRRLDEIFSGKASFSIAQQDQTVVATLKLPIA
jgi:sensor histidine kinase YesM